MLLSWTEPESTDSICPPGAVKKIFVPDSRLKSRAFDDLDILPSGNIITSEFSLKYSLDELNKELFEARPNGRLILANPKTGMWKVLADGLHFPNGVQLHPDGKSVLLVESTRARVLRVPLGENGPVTVFVDGLPGYPDNIRTSPRGGFWIPVSNVRDGSLFSLVFERMGQWPFIRRVAYRVNSLISGLELTKTKSSMLLRVDQQGQTVEVWHDPHNRVFNVAEVCEADGHLFTSSYFLPYVGKIRL
ncbi:Adipocyte plasma membrane-associated protein [Fasciolopsis buskii]|uniref:Adipocyte plasma membrane-associated protein n=1 Tax=Fasciolopsis buskii TaxID=27845 RepID=A0A8E0VJR4_9TREM|nr:Adipocyte plasma membrane-associated protein [Fasciolopsis buski]